jgi:hydroxymethylglutaryl-CoA lyase
MRDNIDVLVHEVGPRDGLQSIETIFPTQAKLDWIKSEAAAGVPQIQVGSFVRPDLLREGVDQDSGVNRIRPRAKSERRTECN